MLCCGCRQLAGATGRRRGYAGFGSGCRRNARAAEANARAAEIDAQAKLGKSRFDALGLSPAKGETTLGEGAGTIESWMLSAATVNAAAQTIVTRLKLNGQTVTLLESSDTFDPSFGAVFDAQLGWTTAELHKGE